ncbi:MAG: class I SAM-dependent methyltransferase [Rhodobacterales bacterium]|nr:class I SAM-dependent methyltransferase [Rhodobacterales bacterium]
MANFEGPDDIGDEVGKYTSVSRMHARHAMLIDAHRHVISNANVFQLGAGDGTWCFAFAAAGASQVIGIEEDAKLVERFSDYPDVGMRERIELRCAKPLKALVEEISVGRQYEVVALSGRFTEG